MGHLTVMPIFTPGGRRAKLEKIRAIDHDQTQLSPRRYTVSKVWSVASSPPWPITHKTKVLKN